MQDWLIVFDDAYYCRRELSSAHECAVLLYVDFAFYCSGNAISKLVMFSMVVARLLIMVGEEVMISCLPERQ